jgi:hypothetical protein
MLKASVEVLNKVVGMFVALLDQLEELPLSMLRRNSGLHFNDQNNLFDSLEQFYSVHEHINDIALSTFGREELCINS